MLEGIGLALVILVALAVFFQGGNADPGVADASPTTTIPPTASASPVRSALPRVSPSPSPSVTASPSVAAASPTQTASATPAPSPTPAATARPTSPRRATVDPHLDFADFLSHVNEGRAKVDDLNRALTAAVTVGDRDATRTAAVGILDFVDGERQWLLDHPPADCYAAAHAAGVTMLEAYQTAASLFVDWTNVSGLEGLAALAKAADAATVATDAFTGFGQELVAARCPA
jgi:hypothetical protein